MHTSIVPKELLVPPRRLGHLLAEARLSHGMSLDDAADALGDSWTSLAILEIETGHRPVIDKDLATLTGLYGITTSKLIPDRSHLVLDLEEGVLAVGNRSSKLVPGKAERREILANYLALIYTMRDVRPGTAVPLRLPDLDVLSSVLELPRRGIEDELRQMMITQVGALGRRKRKLHKRLIVPAVGVVVAVTVAGTLLLMSDDANAQESFGTIGASGGQSLIAADQDDTAPAVEIGNAVVQERLADGTEGPVRIRD